MFRNAQFGNTDAIANFNRAKGGSLVQKGKLGVGGPIAKMFRSSATEARNNAVRTELLKALARTFCLDGGIVDEFGGTCFTPEFMDKLSKLLGPAFKREDFAIDRRTGKVVIGKPLTARRITAILKQVDAHLDDEFDLDLYAMKLEEIKKEIGAEGLDNKAFRKAMIDDEQLRPFYKVQMCIQFLKGDYIMLVQAKPGSKKGATKTVYGPNGNAKDKSLLFCNPKYQELERLADDNGTAQKVDKLVYDEIMFLMEGDDAAKYQKSEMWQDFAEPIKKQLRGKVVQVVRPVEAPVGGYKFEPVVKDNLPAVRKLTDDELDSLVESCFFNVNEGV